MSQAPTPLSRKLGIKEGAALATLGAPRGFLRALAPLPEGAEVRARARGPLDVVVFFTARRAELERRFPHLASTLRPHGGLWIAYPKKGSGMPSDLGFREVQEVGLAGGLVDNKSCAIDEVWTAVRFVVRVRDRKAR